MSTPIYSGKDADLSLLRTKRLAFIGYGNQGAAQAQNVRDSGVSQVLIGNRDDGYKDSAIAEGFEVAPIAVLAENPSLALYLWSKIRVVMLYC